MSEEQWERAGGGRGCSDNVGGDVFVRRWQWPTMQGQQAMDNAKHKRGRMTMASDESGHQTTGHRRSSKINKHKARD